uniref:UDP-glucuronosyltransferase n=1 Tax=Clastoptera arizonana TaxID=38151 RepID=A0A1B6DR56_9HEMI
MDIKLFDLSIEVTSAYGSISYLFVPGSSMSAKNTLTRSLIYTVGQQTCRDTLSDKNVQRILHSEQNFDLVIAEIALVQECFLGLGYRFNAPVISLATFPGRKVIDEYIGSPDTSAYYPYWSTSYTDQMNFFQRGWNFFTSIQHMFIHYFHHLPVIEEITKEYIPNSTYMPSIIDMLANLSLILVNSHIGVTYSRPYNPNTVEVGGMHIPIDRKPLQKDLQEFLDDAKEGFVYFSLGSNIPTHLMPENVIEIFVKVFSEINQKVVWKIDKDTLNNLSANVKIVKWISQHDVLVHENCKVFITHGGMLSIEEAIHFGVPLLGFPFFGDQPMNLAFVEQKSIGLKMEFEDITYKTFKRSLKELLNNPMYFKNMKLQSAIFNDQPITPMEKAVYWIEYVLRHQGAPHLKTAALELSWFQYYSIDIFIFLLLIVLLVMWLLLKIIAIFCRLRSKKHN